MPSMEIPTAPISQRAVVFTFGPNGTVSVIECAVTDDGSGL